MGLGLAPELQREPGRQGTLGAESGDSPARRGCQGPASAHPAPRSQPGFSGLLECWRGLSQTWFSEAPHGFPAQGSRQTDRRAQRSPHPTRGLSEAPKSGELSRIWKSLPETLE